jgi:phage-related protein
LAPLDNYGDIPIIKEVTIKRPEPKPCVFMGSSRKDLKRFPAKVQNRMGHALHQVQEGEEPIAAKALKGFGGRAILELVDDFDSNTYRAAPSKTLNLSNRACVMLRSITVRTQTKEGASHDQT